MHRRGFLVDVYKLLHRQESGQSMAIVALMLFVLLGISAFVVDIGYKTYQRSQLQNAADSAALAGAMLITELADDNEVKLKTIEYANLNLNQEVATVLPIITRSEKTVEVRIEQKLSKAFAGIFKQEDTFISVIAKAKCSYQWDGEALPFVNLDDIYTVGGNIVLWEKIVDSSGDFESLWKDEIEVVNADDVDKTYINVNYSDGLTITKGVVANVKGAVQVIMDQNRPVYVLSLSNDVINQQVYNNLENKLTLDYKHFVLLKANMISFEPNGNEQRIELEVLDIYDIVNNEFPKDYLNIQAARIVSSLIE